MRYLYLARHAEARLDGLDLTDRGRRQAALLGDRLRDVPFAQVTHSPVGRAARTAQLVIDGRPDVPVTESAAAGDFVPDLPDGGEVPAELAERVAQFRAVYGPPELQQGVELAHAARAAFTGPVAGPGPRYELVVTHAFLVGMLVAEATGAPPWRWLTLNAGNAALTVIRYAPDRLPSVLVYNDMAHLPAELRWTGFPEDVRVP